MYTTGSYKLWSYVVRRERVACLLLEMSTDLLQLTNLLFLVNRYMTSIVNDMFHLQLPFVVCFVPALIWLKTSRQTAVYELSPFSSY